MIFYYVRHGDPIYNPDSLTENGREQANALSKRFKKYGLDEIYCSTSERAKMTAAPTAKILNKDVTYLDWTNEHYTWLALCVFNEQNVRQWAYSRDEFIEMFRREDVKRLGSEWYTHDCFKDCEIDFKKEFDRINTETDKFFESLGYKHDRENNRYVELQKNDKRVALFAHQGFGFAFLSSLLDVPYPTFCTTFDLGLTGVTVIEFKSNKNGIVYPKVLQLSSDSHLYKEDAYGLYGNRINI